MRVGLSEKQRALRRTGIGASEVAALAGLSRFMTPIQIYEGKVLGFAQDSTFQMELGQYFEEPVSQIYAERTGRRHLSHPGTVRSREYDFALATPDRAVHSVRHPKKQTEDWSTVERLLQCKETGWRQREHWKDPTKDPEGIPQEVRVQVTWEMGVTGIRRNDVAVLIEREEFFHYEFEFDAELFGVLLEIVRRFWIDHVLARTPPPPDASAQYTEFLQRNWRDEEEEGVITLATPEIETVAADLQRVEEEIKRLEAVKDLRQNEVRGFIGRAVGLMLGDGRKITWKKTKDGTATDWEGVARDLLDAACPKQADAESSRIWLEHFRAIVARRTRIVHGHRRLWKPWSRQPPKKET